MSIIAEIGIRSRDLALTETFDAVPGMRVTVVNELGTECGRHYLIFSASPPDAGTFEAAMAEDPTVADVHRYTELEDSVLYRIRLSAETEVVPYDGWVAVGADYIEAWYADGWWRARMRFPDREALSAFEEWCTDNGLDFELESIYEDRSTDVGTTVTTEPQREVLRVALAEGYFEVPREASMADIAARLGISEQAVSERLRRGHRALVAEHVGTPGE
jgi:predicted DNA binding protein